MNKISPVVFVFSAFLMISCAKTNVEVEEFGDISGVVIDSETEEGIRNVNITTTPPSSSILTNNDGSFEIIGVPAGGYTVQARKPGFINNSVSISVNDDDVTTARIFLEPEEEELPPEANVIQVEVTSWFNAISGDSSFVEVEYSVTNVSERTDASEYQVVFEILTSNETFFFDANGTDLKQGQKDVENFRKFIRNETATDVLIDDTWFEADSTGDGSQ